MTDQQFIDAVTGKPWRDRATGPDAYDCWGIIIKYFEQVMGVNIPVVQGYASGETPITDGFFQQVESGKWQKSSSKTGVVFMAFVGEVPVHCGLVIGDYCLHALGSLEQGGQVYYHKQRVISRMYERTEFWEYIG